MIAFVIALSLSLVVTNGMGSMKCGFRIRNARGCYLNAGHLADNTQTYTEQKARHNLDSYWEYNAMWQCSGTTSGRIWYFEGGKPDSRLFSIFPDRNNQYQEFFLETDTSHYNGNGYGVDVNQNEFNAKVDRVSSRKIGYVTGGTLQSGWYILVIKDSAGKLLFALQGGYVKRWYDLVTTQRVYGYEAKFERMYDDYGKKADNAIQLIPYPCGVKTGTSDIDPIIDPMPGNNPDASSYVIQVSTQSVTYIIVILSILLLVNLFCFCSWKKSSGKVNYKRVKYDSDTDAV